MFLKRFFTLISNLESKLEKILRVFFNCQFYVKKLDCELTNLWTQPKTSYFYLKNHFLTFLFLDIFWLKASFLIYRWWSTFELRKVDHSHYLKYYGFFQKKSKNKRVIKINFRTFLFLYFFDKSPPFWDTENVQLFGSQKLNILCRSKTKPLIKKILGTKKVGIDFFG